MNGFFNFFGVDYDIRGYRMLRIQNAIWLKYIMEGASSKL
jgi:hypothetical protein